MKKSVLFVLVLTLLAMTTTAYAVVTPSINIQGTQGSYIWSTAYVAPTISIGMQTDEKISADWWFLCLTPTGWKYFSLAYGDGYWFDGSYPSYQGNLASFGQTKISTAGLDFSYPGSYMFFFGIDKIMDGQITAESLAYDVQSVNVFPSSSGKTALVTIFDSFQVLVFDKLTDDNIRGFVNENNYSPINPTLVKKVKEVSDRVGWTGDSVATVDYDSGMVTIIIPNTANNDRCEWVLELSNGDFAWANPNNTAFTGKPVTWNATAGLFEYGGYKKQTVTFSDGVAYIDFACNLTDGLVSYVNPNDIAYVRWNSDQTGWNEFSAVTGLLQMDSQGNFFVKLTGLPSGVVNMTASQLFSVVLKNGTVVWANVDKWIYSSARH